MCMEDIQDGETRRLEEVDVIKSKEKGDQRVHRRRVNDGEIRKRKNR